MLKDLYQTIFGSLYPRDIVCSGRVQHDGCARAIANLREIVQDDRRWLDGVMNGHTRVMAIAARRNEAEHSLQLLWQAMREPVPDGIRAEAIEICAKWAQIRRHAIEQTMGDNVVRRERADPQWFAEEARTIFWSAAWGALEGHVDGSQLSMKATSLLQHWQDAGWQAEPGLQQIEHQLNHDLATAAMGINLSLGGKAVADTVNAFDIIRASIVAMKFLPASQEVLLGSCSCHLVVGRQSRVIYRPMALSPGEWYLPLSPFFEALATRVSSDSEPEQAELIDELLTIGMPMADRPYGATDAAPDSQAVQRHREAVAQAPHRGQAVLVGPHARQLLPQAHHAHLQ